MVTDEQLIERIRAGLNDEVVGLRPPADLLDRLRSAPQAPRRTLAAPSRFGGALGMVASVVVVGVVIVAIMTVGHRSTSPNGVSAAPAGTRGLVARLAVLRRAQTAADRLPASIIADEASAGGGLRIIPSLTRLAARVHAGPGPLSAVAVYVVVGKPRGYPADIVTAVVLAGRPGHRYLLYPANVVDTATAAATGGLTPRAVSFNGNGARDVLNVGVVPDGVTRVKWVVTEDVAVYPKVENNVAVPKASRVRGLLGATWYGSDGRVVASYSRFAQQRADAARALAESARQPIAPALTGHFALLRQPIPRPATIKRLPERTAVVIADQGYGLNVTQARFVPYPGTPGLWVIPGASGVSMAELSGGGGGGGNVPVAIALGGGMITTSCCAPAGRTVWGLVPDGNPTVSAVLADGRSKTIRVIDNVYSITGNVTAILARNATGRRVTIKAVG